MKSNAKSRIMILIAVGILFALSPMVTVNFIFIMDYNNKGSEYNDEIYFDNKNLKISAVSEKIHIDNNWTAAKSAGICTGDGTYSEPYIIEDLVIDAESSGSCILIENSDVYFRIENCTLYNSGSGATDAGMLLIYVNKSRLIDNNCFSNYVGIQLYNSTANTISGNTANDNDYGIVIVYSINNTVSENTENNNIWEGIFIIDCNNNTISGNNANSNYRGIYLKNSDYNDILGNTANNNHDEGIFLIESNNNTISGNTANNNVYGISLWNSDCNKVSGNILLGNDGCIKEANCEGNLIENNDCGIIPGYNLIFLLGALSVAVILISKKLKKS